MKISFPSLFSAPIQKYRFFFLFGNEETVFERAISFLQKKLLSSLQIKAEVDLLNHTSLSPSLFEAEENPSLTLVPHVTDKLLHHVDQLTRGVFIFTSQKARAQSKLVTYFTESPVSLAIGAYATPLLPSEFEFLIGDLNLPAHFKSLLFKTFQNDYMGLLSTLEKVKLFKDIPENQYEAFLGSFAPDDFMPLLQAFLLKDIKKGTEASSFITSTDIIPFLRSLTRAFQTLFELMPFKNSPKSIPWQKLTPPVFFKEQPLYEMALSRWNFMEIRNFLEGLLELERKVKLSASSLPHIHHELLSFIK